MIFALFSIIDICTLLCIYVKGVILNEDLMIDDDDDINHSKSIWMISYQK